MFFRNHLKRSHQFIGLFVLLAAWLLPLQAQADVRILLDVSRSMAQSDPENRRIDAISQLIEALPSGEKAGIWTFGQYVNMVVPHRDVNAQWKRDALAAMSTLNAPAVRTNIGGALEKSSYDFGYSTYTGPVHFILITDGRVDIAPNQEVNGVERTRLIDWVVPNFIAANAVIHTIGISENADSSLLKQLSDQSGGQHHSLNTTQNLANSLFSVMAEAAPTNQIPMVNKGFSVDSGIREVTVLMRHNTGAVSLVSPSGVETSAVAPADQRWRVGPGYTQVSMESPMSGRWQVKGSIADDSEIRVLSDISIEWLKPSQSSVAQGSTVVLEAEIVGPEGQRIDDDVSRLMEVDLKVNQLPVSANIQNGVIRAQIQPMQNHRPVEIELILDGGTFSRMMYRQLRYVAPFTSEVLLTKTHYEWRLYPNQRLNRVESVQAMVEAQSEQNNISGQFVEAEGGYYVWQLPFDAQIGEYTATLEGKLLTSDGEVMLPTQSIQLMIPPMASGEFLMTPEWAEQQAAAVQEEVPVEPVEPIIEEVPVVELSPDAQWEDEAMEEEGESNMLLYALLSIPGLLILVIAYLFYRRLESKARTSASEDELLLGDDDFADLDSAGNDSDLDLSISDDDNDEFIDAPVMNDIVEDEDDEDLPTPEATEAPKANMEDMLDDAAEQQVPDELESLEEGEDDDLFDISSIDDDLADLDLSLDGDDPFAEEDEDKP
ncbi:vWA domain-containing protein [Reinekea sp.]|jgi:Mg-chelatase subunit ChlD|uniref:vWA domain-containing protein n=1 Tax=Reinekea sp. TaxID=1970455 RepID=UPI003988D61F